MIGFGTYDGLETMYADRPYWGIEEARCAIENELHHQIGYGKTEKKVERIEKRYVLRFTPNSN